jgi:4-amino-4-deoxy-L-arabinose transferase-like glycosyltransferase
VPRLPTTFRGRLALIVAGAVVLRLIYIYVLARSVSMAGDAHYYHLQANLLADGRGFIEPFVAAAYGEDYPTAAHPPLYPLLLSVTSLFGGTGVLTHRAVGAVVGGLVIVVVALIGRRIGGDRVGLIAAGLAALYPTLIAADGAPMAESLYGLLVATGLLFALRLHERGDLASAVGLGAAIGLAALTRSEALGLIPLLAWPLALRVRGRRPALFAATTLACVAVLLPWSIRNWSAFDAPLTISHNDATVLAGANCDKTYSGVDLGGWRFDCLSPRRTFAEGKQADTWREEGVDYIRDHAGELPKVVAVRLLRSWDLYQPRRQVGFAEGRAKWATRAGLVVYGLLVPLAIYGGLLLARRSRAHLLILMTPVLLVLASSVIAYGIPRFRHAAELVIVLLAALALSSLADRRSRRPRRAAGAAA